MNPLTDKEYLDKIRDQLNKHLIFCPQCMEWMKVLDLELSDGKTIIYCPECNRQCRLKIT